VAENPKREKSPQEPSSEDEKLLSLARERFQLSAEATSDHRRESLDDLEFVAGNQWPHDVKRERELDGRPCLVSNRLPTYIRQVENDQRQNKPAIKVHPVDDNADPDTAKVFQGLIRHIEYNSNADVAYDTAFAGAVRGGLGWFRIITAYKDAQSFNQEVLIKRIRNPFMVYGDPFSKEPDGSDQNFCFYIEDVSPKDFEELYPDAGEHSSDTYESIGDQAPTWLPGGSVRVAEYFYREMKPVDLVLLSNGAVFEKGKEPKVLPEGVTVTKERTAKIPVVKWCKITGIKVLERGEFPSQYIPIIPVVGEELDVNGKLILKGIVRDAKDPQRQLNYFISCQTETIALAPRAPFIGAEGQFEGHEAMWKTANKRNHPYLQYKPKTFADGSPMPAPQRQVYEPPVQAITMALGQSVDEMKAITGIHDASLGNRSNESSGIAIQRRNAQSQTSNFHLVDNLNRSIRHAGRILLEVAPKVYDTADVVRVIGEDGEQEIVKINQIFQKKGEDIEHNLSVGKYDCTVEAGPSYATKRQEAVASMIELTKVHPQVAQVAGDLMVKNMDWPGAQDIAQRLRKALPPGMADDEKENPIPPQAKAMLEQQGQMIQQLTEQLQAATSPIELKRMDLESRERIENAKLKADIEIAMLKVGSTESLQLLAHQLSEIQQRQSLLNTQVPVGDDQYQEQQPVMAAPEQFQEQPAMEMPPEQPTGGLSPGEPSGEIL
jgi:hypothetical protein